MKDTSVLDRMTPREKEALGLLVKSGPAAQLMADAELERLEQRRRDSAERAALPNRYVARRIAAGQAYVQAIHANEAAKANARAALDALLAAQTATYAADHGEQAAAYALDQRLLQCADERLRAFARYTDDLFGIVGHALKFGQGWAPDGWGGQKSVLLSNGEEMALTCAALRAASAECGRMLLEALDRNQITARLQSMCDRLRHMLELFSLEPPNVTDEEVRVPRSYRTTGGIDESVR